MKSRTPKRPRSAHGISAAFAALAAMLCLAPDASAQKSVYQGVYVTNYMQSQWDKVTTWTTDAGKAPSIINVFVQWKPDSSNNHKFNANSRMQVIRSYGAIPLITWQPSGGPSEDAQWQLQDILDGNYDDYITEWAIEARDWGSPFFLRLAHEMNATWYPWCGVVNGNTPAKYVQMWRHVHDIFREVGATNVTWVWCVNKHYTGSDTPLSYYYPGDQYVDWVAIDAYNRGNLNGYSWQEFLPLANTPSGSQGGALNNILAIAPGKPAMVAETGCVESGGDKAQWFRTVLKNDLKWTAPRIKAWMYFNTSAGGYNNTITTTSTAKAAYQESIGLSYYAANEYGAISGSPIQPLTNDATTTDAMAPFVSIYNPRGVTVAAGTKVIVRARVSDKSGIQKVDFSVNGALMFSDTSSPYEYAWNIPAGANVNYTVTARAYDNSTAHNNTLSTVAVKSQ